MSTDTKRPTRVPRLVTALFLLTIVSQIATAVPTAATYLGGSGADLAKAVALDAAHNIYVVSTTASGNFPGLKAADFSTYRYKGSMRCVVTVLDATGSRALKTFPLPPPGLSSGIHVKTTAGAGNWNDGDCNPTAIHVDDHGDIYVAGATGLIAIAGDPNHSASTLPSAMLGFVTKLDSSGTVLYSTIIGGYSAADSGKPASYDNEKSRTFPTSMAVDKFGNSVIGGWTTSSLLLGTTGSLQPSLRSSGVAGFLATLDASGALTAATFLGESKPISLSSDSTTQVNDLALNADGDIVVAGSSDSTNMQVTGDAFDTTSTGSTHGFLLIASRDLKTLIHGSAIVGLRTAKCVSSLPDELAFQRRPLLTEASSITLDDTGNIYLAGRTTSPCLPVTAGAWQRIPRTLESAYLLRMNTKRSVDFLSYFDLAAGTSSAPKLALEAKSVSSATLVMAQNAMGAQAASWPTYRAPISGTPNIGTSNVFIERFRLAMDASSSTVESIESMGASFATSMLSAALSPDGNSLAIVGTTKAGDLPVTTAPLSAANQGDRDGFVAVFDAR